MVAPTPPTREEFLADFPTYLPGADARDVARGIDSYALRNGLSYDPEDSYLSNEARREIVIQLADWAEEALASGEIAAPKNPQKRVAPRTVDRPLPEGVTEESLEETVAAELASNSPE